MVWSKKISSTRPNVSEAFPISNLGRQTGGSGSQSKGFQDQNYDSKLQESHPKAGNSSKLASNFFGKN